MVRTGDYGSVSDRGPFLSVPQGESVNMKDYYEEYINKDQSLGRD